MRNHPNLATKEPLFFNLSSGAYLAWSKPVSSIFGLRGHSQSNLFTDFTFDFYGDACSEINAKYDHWFTFIDKKGGDVEVRVKVNYDHWFTYDYL